MTLADLYIAHTVAKVPEDQRAEISAELAEAIGDAVDAHVSAHAGTSREDAEREVLTSMGDPEALAATYAGRRLYLIGPELFLKWKRLTILLLWIVLPIVAVLIPLGMWLGDEPVGSIIGTTLGGTLTVGVHLVFWVTLVFAVMERTGLGADDLGEPWTVDDLTSPPDPSVPRSDTVGSAATLILTALFLVWQQLYPWATNADGEGLPLLNPDLWTFVLPALLVIIAVELVAVIRRHMRGYWTRADAWVTVALNVAAFVVVGIAVAQHALLNRELFAQIGWPDAATTVTLDQIEWLTLAALTVIGVVDVVGAFRKALSATPSRG